MELELVKLLAELGTGTLFSVLVLLLLRDERKSREAAREADRDVIATLAAVVNRIDERTAILVGDVTPVDRGPYREPTAPQRRTPPLGAPTEYSHHVRRR